MAVGKLGGGLLLLLAMFFAGRSVGYVSGTMEENVVQNMLDDGAKQQSIEKKQEAVAEQSSQTATTAEQNLQVEQMQVEQNLQVEQEKSPESGAEELQGEAAARNTSAAVAWLGSGVLEETQNWGLGFGAEGTKPTGNASAEELAEYNAYFVGPDEEKVIYLTFDCGYENGNTEPILDALKKHGVSATFFVVGHYLESAPELVKRMVEEGHTVGNHTYHHPDMSAIAGMDKFKEETDSVNTLFEEITGQKMAPYFRPPQGKYNAENLKMAKELGYHTFFWSLAYVDWNTDDQPSKEEALEKLCSRIHPGAVVLLHNTSATNGAVMDELLAKWKEMGYSFGTLADICGVK